MKKQNGFSQIFVMVVMLILAIALPVTANLVKKVQDNRSSAAPSDFVGCVDGTSRCDGEYFRFCRSGYENKIFCNYGCSAGECKAKPAPITAPTVGSSAWTALNNMGGISYKSTTVAKGNCTGVSGVCGTFPGKQTSGTCAVISADSASIIKGNIITGKCDGGADIRCCSGSASAPVAAPAAPAAAENIDCAGKAYLALYSDVAADAYYGTHPQAHYDLHDGARIWPANGCVGNDGTYSCATGNAVIVNCGGLGCSNGVCNPAPAAPAPVTETPTCEGQVYLALNPDVKNAGWPPQKHYDTVHASEPGRIWPTNGCIANDGSYSCDASLNPTIINCGGLGCSNGACNPAPCVPDNSCAANTLVGQTCTNNCDQTVNGTKPAPCVPDNSCAANTLVGQTCTNNCDQAVSGVKPVPCVPDNSCAANTLVGQTCTNNCDQTVSGVKPIPINGALGPANGTIVTIKPTSDGACSAGSVTWIDSVATDGTYDWTCTGINGGTSRDGSATKADCTIGNQKCTTNNKYYTCTDGLWAHSTTITDCASGQICTNGEIGACRTPEYAAPNLNMLFAISGVKVVKPCFGDLKFKIDVAKDGVAGITREVTAIVMANSFNKNGDQVFKIADFALTSNYALTDKIKISVGGKKSLATSYGKDNQTAGFAALNESQLLVSSLSNNTLKLYEYPVLNGDIGAEGSLGTADNVVNGIDFAFMKNEWGKTCSNGENLAADLNGDCRVDTFDLQILKNAMGEQYAQKTF